MGQISKHQDLSFSFKKRWHDAVIPSKDIERKVRTLNLVLILSP